MMIKNLSIASKLDVRFARAAALCLFAFAASVLAPAEARAQWTTTGTNTTTTNNVGVGTATPTSKMVISSNAATPPAPQDGTILHLVNTDNVKTRLTIDGFGGPLAQPSVTFRSARGTAALPTASQANDLLGVIHGTGYGTSGFLTGSKPSIMMIATENWTDTTAGSAIFFNTVKNGTNTTAERMRLTGDGNLGLGTSTPGVLNGVNFTPYIPLHIKGPATTQANMVIDSPLGASGYVLNDSSQPLDGRIWTMTQAAGGGKLTFSTYTDAGTGTPRLVIDRAGNVGVGTTAPASMLHVAGNVTIDGNINAKWQDVAEWVPTTQKLSAGTVVVLDAARDNHVAASLKAYDTRVAGVVSARPGLTLGEAGEGKALVATTGRVKVKVDATRAPIQIGDLIVTGDAPGTAMRSEPVSFGGVEMHRPGTIIGKALEPLSKGTGEILVLLSLQ